MTGTRQPEWTLPQDPDLLAEHTARLAASVGDLVAASEAHLVRIIRDHVQRDLGAPAYHVHRLAELASAHMALRKAVGGDWEAIRRAVLTVLKEAREAGQGLAETDLNNQNYTLPPQTSAALDRIAADTIRTITGLPALVLRDALDTYQQVAATATALVATGSATSREAMAQALSDYQRRGITTFRDKTGRAWRIDTYTEMAVRTGAMHALRGGYHDTLTAAGLDLVQVVGHEYTCRLCAPWQGKILSLTGQTVGRTLVEHATRDGVMVPVDVKASLTEAKRAGLFHPNCLHTTAAYFPGASTPSGGAENRETYEASQRQRALERDVRAIKRDLELAPSPDAVEELRASLRARQRDIRQLVADYPALRRLSYREKQMVSDPLQLARRRGRALPMTITVQR